MIFAKSWQINKEINSGIIFWSETPLFNAYKFYFITEMNIYPPTSLLGPSEIFVLYDPANVPNKSIPYVLSMLL